MMKDMISSNQNQKAFGQEKDERQLHKEKMKEIQQVSKAKSRKAMQDSNYSSDNKQIIPNDNFEQINLISQGSPIPKQNKQQTIKNIAEQILKKSGQDPSSYLPFLNFSSSPQAFQSSLQGTAIKINSISNAIPKANNQKGKNLSPTDGLFEDKEQINSVEEPSNVQKPATENNNIEFQKSVLKNLIADKKIPEQILHDETFKSLTKGHENNPEKVAEILMSLYDVVIKPCKNENFKNRPSSTDLNRQSLMKSPQKLSAIPNCHSKKPTGNKFSKILPNTITPIEKSNQKVFGNKTKDVKCNLEDDQVSKIKHFHHSHPINKLINLINKFGSLTYRNKEINFNIPLINQVYRKLGLNLLTQKNNLTIDFLKNKDFMTELKEAMLRKLYNTLNHDNKIEILPAYPSNALYKYCVLNGNNSALVKGLFRQRWWWASGEKDDYLNVNLLWSQWKKQEFISKMGQSQEKASTGIVPNELRICNHLEFNYVLGNKKCMYYNLKSYCDMTKHDLQSIIPLTFHIENINDPEYVKFRSTFSKLDKENALINLRKEETEDYEENEYIEDEAGNIIKNKNYSDSTYNVWIIKPGENSNRGNGINVSNNLKEIHRICQSKARHTYIIQKYIEHPLLINNRKFDIRCYGLFTSFNGNIKGFFYKEGYLRTSSKIFTLENLSHKGIHLTNEAVQIKFDDFGKFEQGNKISYIGFQKYLEKAKVKKELNFYNDIYPKIREVISDTMKSVYSTIDKYKRQHTFELFGYDFMIDENYKVYLIEANINPCLGVTSSFSAQFIPTLIENVFKIAIDPLFPPPEDFAKSKRNINEILSEIKFELIFDENIDKQSLEEISSKNIFKKYEASEKDEVPESYAELYSEDEEK